MGAVRLRRWWGGAIVPEIWVRFVDGRVVQASYRNARPGGTRSFKGNAPAVLSVTSVAEPREDAAPDLLQLPIFGFLCLSGSRGEQEATAMNADAGRGQYL
jgi:hypothetical protein